MNSGIERNASFSHCVLFLLFYSSTDVFFLCAVVRPETDLRTRTLIAGKMQSSQGAVDAQTLAEKVKHLSDDILARQASNTPQNFRESVTEMYVKGGFIASKESLVCSACPCRNF